jgi:3-oxoacyl-[acyl-carrier-protein] synthase III
LTRQVPKPHEGPASEPLDRALPMNQYEHRPAHRNRTRHAAITGWGSSVPPHVVTNRDLESRAGVDSEWIRTRTGIRERRIAGPGETTVSLCTEAAGYALDRARLAPRDVELIICATMTPDRLLPAAGCLVQQRLGATNAAAFDVNSACCGFLTGLAVGAQFIESGRYERVLVVAGETLSRFTDRQDRGTCALFGDGAGAVVLEPTDRGAGVLSCAFGCQGDADGRLVIEAGGSARPATPDTVAAGEHFIRMRGREVFRLAVRGMTAAAGEALARAGLTAADLRQVIPHQANARIIEATREALGLSPDRMFVNVGQYGNTGAASIPLALCEFQEAGPLRAGDHLLLVAFGGGLTWAAAVVCWADVGALLARRSVPSLQAPRLQQGPLAPVWALEASERVFPEYVLCE